MEEEEVWEDTFQNRKIYGAHGPRDVLMIVASESLVGPDIVHRKRGCLTQQDKDRLTSQGIPQECWQDDVKLMQARYLKESRFTISSIEVCEQETKHGYMLSKIENLMCNTTKPGVIIHYIGPGKRDTGDWCFADGFITFRDMMALYMDHFHGAQAKTLKIVSNCSYSGHWVAACREFFDGVGVQPCAHSARKIGILLNLELSCKPNEIGYSLYYSARVQCNDKNTGVLCHYFDYTVEPDQHSMQIRSTVITCGNTIDEECKFLPDYTYQRQYESKRIFLVRGTDEGRPAWHYVLLVDDEETICIFKEKTQGENRGKHTVNANDYGQVLKSGWGEEPPKEAKDWITRTYYGVMPEN